MSTTTKANIYQRVNAVRQDVESVKKAKIKISGGSYNVMLSDDVMDATRQSLIKHGVLIFVRKCDRTFDGQMCHATLTVKFQNVDAPDDSFEVETIGSGMDRGDKASGKAVTYAYKYALLKTLHIVGGDDPDTSPSPTALAPAQKVKQAVLKSSNRPFLEKMTPADKNKFMDYATREVANYNLSDGDIQKLVDGYKGDSIPFGD